MSGWVNGWAERAVMQALSRWSEGRLLVETPSGPRAFGVDRGAMATLRIHSPNFYRRVLLDGEIGLGEGYMAGEWSTPDLVGLIRAMFANAAVMSAPPAIVTWPARIRDGIAHRFRDNSRRGSRRNIHEHYDLGNPFFRLFLDANLLYSCAVYEQADDSLEAAQVNKLRLICQKLDLGPDDRVLEIGSGWGGFAMYAATRHGCHVTTTTISAEQHAYVKELIAAAGDVRSRIDLRLEDYRDLRGRFDKIVSIEMFEAVGLRHYDDFFSACDRLLTPDGIMLMQTITVDDWRFSNYLSSPSWIAKYIFPGAELASVAKILASLARTTKLSLFHLDQIGTHYGRTLHAWRERFHARLDEVRAQGFDDRFIRMWDLYLGYCEAGFLERHIGDVQLLLTKAQNRRTLFGEPWERGGRDARPARSLEDNGSRASVREPL